MHSRFDQFRATPLGKQLEALIDTAERYLEYAALSRAEVPAVAAIVHDLRTKFPEAEADISARQFCGAMVADVMRRYGHEVLRPRGRVNGDFFTYGAVWTPHPRQLSFEDLLVLLSSMPSEVRRLIQAVPQRRWRDRPEGTGFSVVEHICHLRDLDRDVYFDRITRILSENAPDLISVDGVAMAAARGYLQQDFNVAITEFETVRSKLVANLASTTVEERTRWGLFDGLRRTTLLELVADIDRHDRTHLQELRELANEIVEQN